MFVRHQGAVILGIIFATGLRVRSEVDINTVLPKGYQKGQRPRLPGYSNDNSGPPVDVQVSLYVNSFGNIEEAKMEYKMYGYFRQFWNDKRLAGRHNNSIVLKGEDITKIWKPDPYCYNARESTLSASDTDINSLMIIEPNGNIIYSRMTIILAECDMDLRDFPMDLQICYLKFSSYSYSTEHIKMSWKGGNPVTVARTNLAQFYFTELDTKAFIESYALGNYSIIEVHFNFKRRLGYFLIQVYAPDIFVVMLSWIVFWMDRNDMGNRMALGITTILTIMFLMGSINAAMPRVSYPKALDWYLMISFALVFMALIQCTIVFVLVNLYEKKGRKKEEAAKKNDVDVSDYTKAEGNKSEQKILLITENPTYRKRLDGTSAENGAEQNDHLAPRKDSNADLNEDVEEVNMKGSRHVGQWVDTLAKIIFPSVFIGFNIVYWMIFLHV